MRKKQWSWFSEKSGQGTDRSEKLCGKFSIGIPEYFNVGSDVIDSWAKKDCRIERNELRGAELKIYARIR